MTKYQSEEQLIELLLVRLERISADSYVAHRASGVRGALIRQLEVIRIGDSVSSTNLKKLIDAGFDLVESAASK